MLLSLSLFACLPKPTPPAASADPTACSAPLLSLDTLAADCAVEGLQAPARIVSPEALELRVALEPPAEAGGMIRVRAELVNVTDAPLELDLEIVRDRPEPLPLLLSKDGFRVESDQDASCADYEPPSVGGLGALPYSPSTVARVTLPPGGVIAATRELPARKGLCVCTSVEGGLLEMDCTPGLGGPAAPGSYNVGLSFPAAIERRDGYGPHTSPYLRAPIEF